MNISQEFAPPYKLVIPYFVIGVIFYVVSMLYTFSFDMNNLHYEDPVILAWVHLYLLGFVMIIIFGAMAQLLPVVLEVGHFSVELFYIIWPLLSIGALLMAGGFLFSPTLLPYGGTVVLISMMIFIFEIFMTLKRVEKFNLAITTVLLANVSLFMGVIVGIIMALGYAGQVDVNITSLLMTHIYLVVGGYIIMSIMGLSMILLPMFGLSHGFDETPVRISVYLMSASVVLVLFASLFSLSFLAYIAYALSAIAMVSYLKQIQIIYQNRARKIQDIYSYSMMISYGSLFLAVLFALVNFFTQTHSFLFLSAWLSFIGFFGFLISGHLYKIVPFLVWFEVFSPLVGKEKVPMLVDMVPDKATKFQFYFSVIGLVLSSLGIVFSNDALFKAGVSFLFMGAIFFMNSVIYILKYK